MLSSFKAFTFYMCAFFAGAISSESAGQTFTIDYLTYFDRPQISDKPVKLGLDGFLFLGIRQFTIPNGSAGVDLAVVYFYAPLILRPLPRFELAVIPQMAFSSSLAISTPLDDILFVGKYRPNPRIPLTLRIGFKLGTLGSNSLILPYNSLDLGILGDFKLENIHFEGDLSYRINGQSKESAIFTPIGKFNEIGDMIHFRMEVMGAINDKMALSGMLMGYVSGNKKLDGKTIDNSDSHKQSVGIALEVRPNKGPPGKVGVLVDVWGKLDNQGISITLSIGE